MAKVACDAADVGEPQLREGVPDDGVLRQSGRLVAWWRKSTLTVPGWICPVVVIVVTGLLGRNPHNQELACWWLGLIGGLVAYYLTYIAFEPAPYAKRLASVVAVVAALAVAQLLLHHIGHGLLNT